MSALLGAFEAPARVIAAVLLNSLWEDALLVLAVWGMLRILRNTNATTRYFCWIITLLAAVILPVVSTVPQITSAALTAAAAGNGASHQLVSRDAFPARSAHPAIAQSVAADAGRRFRLPDRVRMSVPSWTALVCFALWILAALVIAIRLTIDLIRLERLKADAMPLPLEFRDQLERWVERAYGSARDIRICTSEHIEVPVAIGLFDSMILLPSHLLPELSAGEIDRISLHELAHLRRRDDWTNTLQRVVQILFFFNPAIRAIGAQLDLEREVACDDWVLEVTGDVRPYATCLHKMAELAAWPHQALAAPGVFITRKGISVRIERLLNKKRNARASVAYGIPLAVTIALAAFFVLASGITPVIAYTNESAGRTATALQQQFVYVYRDRVMPAHQVPPLPPATPVPLKALPIVKPLHALGPALPVGPHLIKGSVPIKPIKPVHGLPAMPASPAASSAAHHARVVTIPAIDVNVPEMNINVPAANVHVPGIHVHVPGREVASGNDVPGCMGCNLSNVSWPGKDLSHHEYNGTQFRNANLQGTNFRGSRLLGVDFRNANLRDANFTDAELSGCDMRGADIHGANFSGAHIVGCDGVNPATMDQGQLRAWLTGCSGCNFRHADFHGMDLHGIRLVGADLRGANLSGANLSDAQLSGGDLREANLSGANLHHTQLTGCDLRSTDLRNVDLSTAQLTGTDLSTSIMR